MRDKENIKKTYNPYGGSKPTFNDTNRKSSSTQRQLCNKISKKLYGEKVIGSSKFLVNEGTPGNSFKICTDILLDKPSILAEETLLCTDV